MKKRFPITAVFFIALFTFTNCLTLNWKEKKDDADHFLSRSYEFNAPYYGCKAVIARKKSGGKEILQIANFLKGKNRVLNLELNSSGKSRVWESEEKITESDPGVYKIGHTIGKKADYYLHPEHSSEKITDCFSSSEYELISVNDRIKFTIWEDDFQNLPKTIELYNLTGILNEDPNVWVTYYSMEKVSKDQFAVRKIQSYSPDSDIKNIQRSRTKYVLAKSLYYGGFS